MPSSKAAIATPHASKYMQQLCKHFAHKVPVDYDAERAQVDFPFGDCLMWAGEGALAVDCTAKSDEDLERMQRVVFDHLKRFAWREEIEANWSVTA